MFLKSGRIINIGISIQNEQKIYILTRFIKPSLRYFLNI